MAFGYSRPSADGPNVDAAFLTAVNARNNVVPASWGETSASSVPGSVSLPFTFSCVESQRL